MWTSLVIIGFVPCATTHYSTCHSHLATRRWRLWALWVPMADSAAEAAKAFDPYEVIGVITPGSVVALLIFIESPTFRGLLGREGLSVGDFGLFILFAFV